MTYPNYLKNLYRPKLDKGRLKNVLYLDKNECPFSAFKTLKDIPFNNSLNLYNEPYSLYKKLSSFINVDINNILISAGSEQAIKFVFDTFLEYEDEVVFPKPSFAMYDIFSYYKKAKVTHLEYNSNRQITLKNLLNNIKINTKLFILANPDNQTGTIFTIDDIIKIAKHCDKNKTIFLLDEAYFEFSMSDTLSLLNRFNNLIITRTFSKAWGLAGLKVGYLISNDKNIDLLRKVKPSYDINSITQTLIEKALSLENNILNKNLKQVKKWQNIFSKTLLIDLEYLKTYANFILLKSNNYEKHKKLLLDNNIIPKMDFKDRSLKNCFKFSISNDSNMYRVLKILEKGF